VRIAPSPVELPDDPAVRFSVVEKARLAGEILMTYGRVRWLLARRELREAVAQLRREAGRHAGGGPPLAKGEEWRFTVPVLRTLRALPLDSRCLIQSLVLLSVLARRSVETDLVIGVRTAPRFGAHAWIEREGSALLEPGDTAHGRLVEL
jgi:Transglutaminase-like superfamily